MLKSFTYRVIGLALVMFCGISWAWMLGAFANTAPALDANTAKWMNPGVLSMPGTLSIIAGLIGLMYLIGVFPLFDGREKAEGSRQ